MGNARSFLKKVMPGNIFKSKASRSSEDDSNLGNTSPNDLSPLNDVLDYILSFLSPEDLIFHCRFVCKEWKELVDGNGVWKIKCIREKKNIPSAVIHPIPKHYFRRIYIFNPFGRNLVYNPCGNGKIK